MDDSFNPDGYTREEWSAEMERARAIDDARRAEEWRLECEERAAEERAAAELEARWKAAEERRRAQARFEIPFLKTSVARIIMSTIDRSLRYGQNSLIIGVPGVGKTRALREIVRRGAVGELEYDVALIDVTATIGTSLREVFREVGAALDVEPIDHNADMRRRMVKHAARFPVILFDEAQNLGYKQLRDVLGLSVEIGVQMVFCGNGEVLKLVNSGQGAIQQISRRLPFREEINCILDADADLIASHFGVEGMDAHRLCREIGGRFHADGVAKVLTIARDRNGDHKTIHLPAIREALGLMPHFVAGLASDRRPKRVQRQTTLGPA